MTDKTKPWRVLIALIAAVGPILQYGLTAHDAAPGTLAMKTVEYFSYFTILSNILGAVVLAAPLVAPASRLAAWSEKAGARAVVAAYLTITAVVYHTMLAHQWNPKGLHLAATTINHTITPAAFLLDLILRGGEGEARWVVALKALIFPIVFAAWTLLHGALSGFYPYPFMNVAKRGYPPVLATIVQMGVAFALVCLAYLALLRVRSRMALAKPAPISA